MNFGKFDILILVSMSIAVIGMSFTFPAMGLTTMNETEEGDVPEFNSSADDFDFAGEFPDRPGTPSQGDLVGIGDETWLDGDVSNGTTISLTNDTSTPGDNPEVHLNNYDQGFDEETSVTIASEGDTEQLEAYGYTMDVEWVSTQTIDDEDEITVRWHAVHQPSDQTWYNRIPVVGSVFGVGEQLAGIVGWIGSIIYWIVAFFITILVNVFFALFDTIVFTASLMHWLISTYMSVVAAANGFASVFVLTPGLLLFLVFLKLTFITISLLWIG